MRAPWRWRNFGRDRKSTRLNSSHLGISYAVFCLKKKKKKYSTFNYLKKKKININIQQFQFIHLFSFCFSLFYIYFDVHHLPLFFFFFFFNDTATTEIYTLSLHDALPILVVLGDVVEPHEDVVAGDGP